MTFFLPFKKQREFIRDKFERIKIEKGKNNIVKFNPKIKFKRFEVSGTNNVVVINSKNIKFPQQFKIQGNNNMVVIDENAKGNLTLELLVAGDNNSVKIGKNVDGNLRIMLVNNSYADKFIKDCSIAIGDDTYIGYPSTMLLHENNSSITVGKNCMFSADVLFHNTDVHSVIDKNTRKLLNRAHDITIGDRVWTAQKVTFLKNVKVSSNSIVGLGSVVTRKFDKENVVIAGVPAKIVKENIDWDWDMPHIYEEKVNNENTKA